VCVLLFHYLLLFDNAIHTCGRVDLLSSSRLCVGSLVVHLFLCPSVQIKQKQAGGSHAIYASSALTQLHVFIFTRVCALKSDGASRRNGGTQRRSCIMVFPRIHGSVKLRVVRGNRKKKKKKTVSSLRFPCLYSRLAPFVHLFRAKLKIEPAGL
jgi:hypothetical protein